mgnify:CR=1 FL=1
MAKIYKTVAIVGGSIMKHQTIEHEGSFWLVPIWVLSTDGRQMRPLRIVSLATVPHTDAGPDVKGPRFVLDMPLPECVLRGVQPSPPAPQFDIREDPPIVFPNPVGLH